MGLVTTALSKRKRACLTGPLQGAALAGTGVYFAAMILKDGMGDLTAPRRGGSGKLNELLLWLKERYPGAKELLPLGMAEVFFIIAAIGLYHVGQKHLCGQPALQRRPEQGCGVSASHPARFNHWLPGF